MTYAVKMHQFIHVFLVNHLRLLKNEFRVGLIFENFTCHIFVVKKSVVCERKIKQNQKIQLIIGKRFSLNTSNVIPAYTQCA